MKKILCLTLVLAMVMSLVPAALAAPAAQVVDAANLQLPEMSNNGLQAPELEEVANMHNTTSGMPANPDTRFATLDTYAPTASWMSIYAWIMPMIEPDLSDTNGYVFVAGQEGGLEWVDQDLEGNGYGETAWATWVVPSTGETLEGNVRDKGEGVYLNASLYKSYTDGVLSPLDEDAEYTVEARVYLGWENETAIYWYDDFVGTNGVNVDVTVPEDGMYVRILLLVYADSQSDKCAMFMIPAEFQTRFNNMDTSKAAELKPDTEVRVDLDSKDCTQILNTNYFQASAKLFKFQAEANVLYYANVSGNQRQGVQYTILDKDMQVVTNIYASSYAIEQYNGNYDPVKAPFWTPVAGTFYIVVGGFWVEDGGIISFEMTQEETNPIGTEKVEIDVSKFGTQSVDETTYSYQWFGSYGMLALTFGGAEYTVKGKNSDVVVYTGEWNTVNLDNCTINSFILGNQFGLVDVNVKGTVTMNGNVVDKIFNWGVYYDTHFWGNTAYIHGDTLKLEGTEGIFLQNYHLYIWVKQLNIDVTTPGGFYPVNIWSMGHEMKKFEFGKNHAFKDPNLKITTAYFGSETDLGGILGAPFCYTLSTYDELFYMSDPDLMYAPQSVTVTSDGDNNGPVGMLGDVNGNGGLDTGDATMILRAVVGAGTLTDEQRQLGDYNQNGGLDTGDATMILRKVVGA